MASSGGGATAAATRGDPAATSPAETILCYPGVFALACQRLAHELHTLGVPILPPYYSLRLLPYVVPQISTWKRRMLREKDLTDALA